MDRLLARVATGAEGDVSAETDQRPEDAAPDSTPTLPVAVPSRRPPRMEDLRAMRTPPPADHEDDEPPPSAA